MKYLIYFYSFLFVFSLSVCSPKATKTFRSYNDYYTKEMYYTDRSSNPLGIQILLIDTTYKKGRKFYIYKSMYGYSIGKNIIGKVDYKKRKNSSYISCNCTEDFMPLIKSDVFFISRMRIILDSLKWGVSDSLIKINGFQKVTKR